MAMEGRTHRPVHDETRCAACSICVGLCPAVRHPEYRGDPATVRGQVLCAGPLPETRDEVRPCRAACPLHQDVPVYVGALAAGRIEDALAVIRATNPLPSVCGTVCNRSCERACVRARVDQAVQIRALKRFAVEQVRRLRGAAEPERRALGLEARSVAVVGSGPAGLAAAHDLAALGRRVAVFDEQPRVGGMLACAIPTFVLSRDALRADLDAIRALGVEFYVGMRVGRDVSLEALRQEYDAVVLAVGAWRGRKLGLPGERFLEEVVDHVEFAHRVSLEGPRPRSGPAVVVGGSTAAFACARIALRLGCAPVTVAFHRPYERLPADPEAVEDAIEEGVQLECLVRPTAVHAAGRTLSAVAFERLREGEPDAWGYRAVEPSGAEPLELPARLLVVAGERVPDLRLLGGMPGLGRTPLGFLAVDGATGMTTVPGLFAAGDVVSGPKGVVEAVAAGRKVAAAVHRYLEAVERGEAPRAAVRAVATPAPEPIRESVEEPFAPAVAKRRPGAESAGEPAAKSVRRPAAKRPPAKRPPAKRPPARPSGKPSARPAPKGSTRRTTPSRRGGRGR